MANDSKLDFGEIMAPQHREGIWGDVYFVGPKPTEVGQENSRRRL